MLLNPVRIGLNDVFYGNFDIMIVVEEARKRHALSKQKSLEQSQQRGKKGRLCAGDIAKKGNINKSHDLITSCYFLAK